MNVAVIPARGGSKRIPRKNIREFCGKPIIAWSISAAIRAGCFERVIVSTDDDQIADVATKLGAEVPFRRPDALSDDHATTGAVMAHAVNWLATKGGVEGACCIYPTAPFLRSEDLLAGLAALERSDCDYAVSVTSYAFPIQRAIRLDDEGRASMFQPEHHSTRSQDLEEAYHDAGQFYWGRASAWVAHHPIFGSAGIGVRLPRKRVQDIDTMEDWEQAELIFRALQNESPT